MKPGIMELTQDFIVIQYHIDKNLATYSVEYLNYPILLGHFSIELIHDLVYQ